MTKPQPLVPADAARIPYPLQAANLGIDAASWQTLVNAIYPSAKTADGVMLAINYCKARRFDPFKRPVHIVPMNTRRVAPDGREYWQTIETVWPGIAELRSTAHRTALYAGCDPAAFGPDVVSEFDLAEGSSDDDHPNAPRSERTARPTQKMRVTHPQWAQVTVYRLVGDQRVAFPGPRVYWQEAYARAGKSTRPNEMWRTRPAGQLEKCAEAAALRKAFPEEIGSEYTIDEAPRMVDVTPTTSVPAERPDRTEIDRPPSKPAAAEQPAVEAVASADPAMPEALEHALAALQRMTSLEEIAGARKQARADLASEDFRVWNTAAYEKERTMKGRA